MSRAFIMLSDSVCDTPVHLTHRLQVVANNILVHTLSALVCCFSQGGASQLSSAQNCSREYSSNPTVTQHHDDHHLFDCLRTPFETTATRFLLALLVGRPAASFCTPLLYLRGWITTPGVLIIFGRVMSLFAKPTHHSLTFSSFSGCTA
jgi:hypothetical protein